MDLTQEIDNLSNLSVHELQDRYRELFREAPNTHNKSWLVRRVAWKLQATAFGGLTERARQRARELADETELRRLAPKSLPEPATATARVSRSYQPTQDSRLPTAGTRLIRRYRGRHYHVVVLEDGFLYDDVAYRSLSAVAKRITGTNWNGFRFFGLGKEASS